MGNLELCNYDPQKVGKAIKVYDDALKTFKMAIAGILQCKDYDATVGII